MKTVTAKPIEHLHAIKMIWQHSAKTEDIIEAFEQITEYLGQSEELVYVVVDITSKPNFPMAVTINSAFIGPYGHPKLAQWLIVGSNQMARMIERTLSFLARRKNVLWFETEQAVMEHLLTIPNIHKRQSESVEVPIQNL